MLIRQANREDLKQPLWALMSPAKRAGLAPWDVSADWVWSLEAEWRVNGIRRLFRDAAATPRMPRNAPLKTLRQMVEARKILHRAAVRRQVLRKAVVVFDALFGIDEIAASCLLLRERVGAPPVHDRLGRPRSRCLRHSRAFMGPHLFRDRRT